jgi:hypothetical protein
VYKRLYQSTLGLGELCAVASIDGDVAECCGAIVLDIDIGGREKLDKDRDGTSVDELLTVVI